MRLSPGCEGWTPVTQAESRRLEHGDGTKANPKIPDYSGSELPVNFARKFLIVNLTLSQALLFVVERLITVTLVPHCPKPSCITHPSKNQSSDVDCLFSCIVSPHGPSVDCCCGVA